jgi:hypothetical protein
MYLFPHPTLNSSPYHCNRSAKCFFWSPNIRRNLLAVQGMIENRSNVVLDGPLQLIRQDPEEVPLVPVG